VNVDLLVCCYVGLHLILVGEKEEEVTEEVEGEVVG
jgi:predicted RNase H-like nuclease